ncbi:MAG: NAD(P)-dependent oxidoreductase [Chloroflexota bacterium]
MEVGKRIVVTGATGFIGRALTKRLLDDGATVIAFVLPEPLQRSLVVEGAEIVDCDLRYANDARRAVEAASPDLVVHLAAVGVTDPFLPIHDALRGNLEATINLIKAINGACKLIVTRTPTEYDSMNVYAASKAAAWEFCKMFFRTQGFPITAVMPFQVYGRGLSERSLLGAALKAARNDESFPTTSGEQVRDWIYIDDVIEGIVATSRAQNVEGETIELGTGAGTPVRDVVKKVFDLVGRGQPLIGALPQRAGEVAQQIANAERSETLTGWRAKIGLDEGLKWMIRDE